MTCGADARRPPDFQEYLFQPPDRRLESFLGSCDRYPWSDEKTKAGRRVRIAAPAAL
jgi:hypothetical protein